MDAASEWSVGGQRVQVGDCLALLGQLPEGSVDMVMTSPPYNIGVTYSIYDDNRPRAEYLAWLGKIALVLARVLAEDGSLFLNVGNASSDPWLATDAVGVFREWFRPPNQIVWAKSLSIGKDTFGHFKPLRSSRFLNPTHEAIRHFTETGAVPIDRLAVGVPFADKSNIARFGHAQDRRCAGNVWFIPYETVRAKAQKFHHPAGFPVALAERCIRLHGSAGATMLDPFLGVGSTLGAAERLGCRGIGFEIDRRYAEVAVARLRGALAAPHDRHGGQTPSKANGAGGAEKGT